MSFLRLALAQKNATVGDLKGNAAKVLEAVSEAKKLQADIVVFPELFLTGYPPEDLLLHPAFISDNLKELKELTKKVEGIIAIVGFVDKGNKHPPHLRGEGDNFSLLYNAAAVIAHQKILGIVHKICLPNYGVFDEKRYFATGDKPAILALGNIPIGINICEDIWVGDGPVAAQTRKGGAKLLINISASPFHSGKTGLREKVLHGHAKKHKLYMVYCNLVGGQDELVFDGSSMVMNPQGRLLGMAKSCEEDLLLADIPIEKLQGKGKWKVGSGKWKKQKIQNIHLPKFILQPKDRKVPPKSISRPERLEEIYQALVLGTRDYVRKNGFEKAVIGISGGIDSALTAVIAVDALGKENVVGVSMPSIFSSEGTKSDAKALADRLGISFFEIPIHAVFQSYLEILSPAFEGTKPGVTQENLQARIRGSILMALSNQFGWLVLTTGNKSELSTGYCTLYGDMSGGFAVIKDVPKMEVYRLARYRNQRQTADLIPQSVIERAPTAELRSNQTDQDTLPPYPVLDEIVESYVEGDKSISQIVKKVKEEDLVRKVIRMINRNEYKRRQSPPGVKITPRAFGRDRRFPITNQYGL